MCPRTARQLKYGAPRRSLIFNFPFSILHWANKKTSPSKERSFYLRLRHHHAAFKLGAALDVLHDGIELVEIERLCTVAEGVCRDRYAPR